MIGPTDSDVSQWDVLRWAIEQAQYLSPTQHHVLLYLCANAFYTNNNPEVAPVGSVLSAHARVKNIQMGTALSRRAVEYALVELQEKAYIYAALKTGNGQSRILVCWSSGADALRSEIRAGVTALPKEFQRKKYTPLKSVKTTSEATVLPFKRRSE